MQARCIRRATLLARGLPQFCWGAAIIMMLPLRKGSGASRLRPRPVASRKSGAGPGRQIFGTGSRSRHQVAARQDRRTGAGERFFRTCARQGGISERKAMIDRHHKLALTKQAALLGISRGSVYYEPAPVSAADLALMRRLDELHLEFPFAGARMLC